MSSLRALTSKKCSVVLVVIFLHLVVLLCLMFWKVGGGHGGWSTPGLNINREEVSTAPSCNISTGNCNVVEVKVPNPLSPVHYHVPLLEEGMSALEKEEFEVALGHALQDSLAVNHVTTKLLGALVRLIKLCVKLTATTVPVTQRDTPLQRVFLGAAGAASPRSLPKSYRMYAGYAGGSEADIQRVVKEGNLRERWGLVYILDKVHVLDTMLYNICEEGKASSLSSALDVSALLERYEEVKLSREAAREIDWYNSRSHGIHSFSFPGFDSWVRFSFENSHHTARWRPGRQLVPGVVTPHGDCSSQLFSNDSSLRPPLSPAEIQAQCRGKEPCELGWCVGRNVLMLGSSSVRDSQGIARPGFLPRARALRYRHVAGPSGTTANVLQWAKLLGFSCHEFSQLRLAMIAWMVPAHDHSLYEILLAAEPFMVDCPTACRLTESAMDMFTMLSCLSEKETRDAKQRLLVELHSYPAQAAMARMSRSSGAVVWESLT